MEGSLHAFRRCLGLLLDALEDEPEEIKDQIRELQRGMVGAQFDASTMRQGGGLLDIKGNLAVEVKSGDEDELEGVLLELAILIAEGLVGEEGESLSLILLNPLGYNKLKIILLLKS